MSALVIPNNDKATMTIHINNSINDLSIVENPFYKAEIGKLIGRIIVTNLKYIP